MKKSNFALTILFAASLTAHSQNIVSNPGFELGGTGSDSISNITDWTLQPTPSGDSAGRFGALNSSFVHTGRKAAGFSTRGSNTELEYLSQNLVTQAGTTYDVSFWLRDTYDGNGQPVEFQLNVGGTLGTTQVGTTSGGSKNFITGGTTLIDYSNTSGNAQFDSTTYQLYTASFLAGSDSTSLIFGGKNSTGPGTLYLDDISIVADASAPEPSTYAMMLGGLALLAFVARRKLA